ncbi:MAG TPA: GGDEF domain-containing protein [Burkholderiales bacterium]|nr:GGDEF domain-containing protein [Burkholderiales bacterium]
MAAAEESLLGAERARNVERRGQRRRRLWIAATAASYGLDGAFLVLFALAGAAPLWVAGAYLGGAALMSGVTYGVMAADWNLRLRDPSLVLPQSVCGILLQAAVALAAPQMAFPWLANLVTVLAFSTIWLSLRRSLALWALCAGLAGALFYGAAGRLGVPLEGPWQTLLSWLFFSVILGRFVFLSAYSAWMRSRLLESRSRLAATMAQVRELASHDELTKVFNRRSIVARLEEERASAMRSGQPFCVALLDLDHFKAVNDTHGHRAGDEALQAFVQTVRATMRETDILGRYGGEEFLMILTDTTLEGGPGATERVCRAVEAAGYGRIAPGLALTVSIGLVAWKPGEDTVSLLGRADAALYRAKANGRNRVEVG